MGQRTRWSAQEDAILREHADKGPKWEGLQELLPGRTYNAICTRRQTLGIAPHGHPSGKPNGSRPWTPEEDAIIRANALRGPSWYGYKTLLPDRTTYAIKQRRNRLGLTFERSGRPYGGTSTKTKHAEWTQADDEALLRLAVRMTRECGHTVNECMARIIELVRERRAQSAPADKT